MTGRGRRAVLGEATLIASATAVAYIVALAYRIGTLVRFGFPLSLASVRLTDAAVAGLVVLVGGSFAFLLVDLVESWREGTLEQLWRVVLVVNGIFMGLVAVLFATVLLFALSTYVGWRWTTFVGVLAAMGAVGLAYVLRHAFSAVSAMEPSSLVLTRLLEKHPAVVVSILVAVALSCIAFYFGISGAWPSATSYLRTERTDEVAISMSEDRVILAGIEKTESDEATLTGSLRVVPLPSTEVKFTSHRVHVLRSPKK